MNVDNYGEVINGDKTYEAIALRLKDKHAVLIGWTDERMTHFDILFNYGADAAIGQVLNGVFVGNEFLSGSFQGGIRPSDLFISIMRVGSFGFEVTDTDTDSGYYQEKIGRNFKFGEPTEEKLAELFNGVKRAIYRINKKWK